MIVGVVNERLEPTIFLSLQSPAGEERRVEAIIDTGFAGQLTIPRALATELRLPYRGTGLTTLADGSISVFQVFSVYVLWDGEARRIEAEAADITPLVGMAMLARHDLHIEAEQDGRVLIQRRRSV